MSYNLPAETLEQASTSARYRASLPSWTLLIRGGMAGAYISMGIALMIAVSIGVEPVLGAGIARLLMGLTFPLGLILIVMTGAELFTGEVLFSPLAVMAHNINIGNILRLWVLVLIGNAIGAIGFALLMVNAVLLQPGADGMLQAAGPVTIATVSLAAQGCLYSGLGGITSCFLKAVACGWILTLALLLAYCADDAIGKIAGIVIAGSSITATGLEHAISNLYIIPAGLLTASYLTPYQIAEVGPEIAALGWGEMIFSNIIPVLAGNITGGLFLGLFLYRLAFHIEQ